MCLFLFMTGTFRVAAQADYYMAGAAFLLKHNYPAAVQSLNQAIARNNSSEMLFIKRGEAFLRLEEYDNAIADFGEANLIVPGVADVWLARAFALSGDHGKALSLLTSHLNSGFRLPEDSIKKDPAFDGLQNTNEWYSLWQKDWYSAEEQAVADGRRYLKRGKNDQALALLDTELANTPSSIMLLAMRGEINLRQGNYAAAVADLSSALELQKTGSKMDPSLQEQVGRELYLRGMAYLKAGRFKDAVNDFNKVLKQDPAFFGAYLSRAEAAAGLKSFDDAIKDVKTYLNYFDNDLQVIYQSGEYYYMAEDYINALKSFNRNLKEDPNNALYFKARGKTYLKTSTYRYAVSDLSMSLDLNPDDAETWMYLGVAKIQSGDKENGCSDLEKSRLMGNTEVLKFIAENCR